ncbi:outer membrane lipoprotein-sorting protein [candidate division FCPU426 bacterium]|nr:outer membrane lipoprotein-sorting protein [candidate division FCPU426 bacterium]
MTIRHRTAGACLALALAVTTTAPVWADGQADGIMQKHFALAEAEDMQGAMVMALREKNGSQTVRTLRMFSKKTKDGTNTYTEFLSPADVKGTKFLTRGNKKGDDDQRLWLPDLGKVRKIAASGKSGAFMGSDFTYYDMENRDFSDADYTLLGEEKWTYVKDSVEKNQTCWKIASVPRDPDAPYARVNIWVSQEDYFAYKMEMFDRKQKQPVKYVYITEVRTFGQVIVPVKTVALAADGHKTLLKMEDIKINTGLDDALFTVKQLQK